MMTFTDLSYFFFIKKKSKLQIVHAALGNYEPNTNNEQDDDGEEAHHNWVNEVVRCEGRGIPIDTDSSYTSLKPRPEKKDPSLLTRSFSIPF